MEFDINKLYEAACHGNTDTIQHLLAADPAAASVANEEGWLALHFAAARGHATALQLLLAAAPAVTGAGDQYGKLPLHWAAKEGQTAAIQLLLAAAPEVATAADQNGRCPLHLAAQEGHAAPILLLLAAAPEAAAVATIIGALPLHLTAGAMDDAAVTELLLAAAPETERALIHDGRSALCLAASQAHLSSSRVLLERSAASTAELLADLLAAVEDPGAVPECLEAVHTLLADLAATCALSPADWEALPTPCPGLARALPVALARSPAEAAQLVAHLPDAARGRLHALAVSLESLQRQLGLELPESIVRGILVVAPLEGE
eukprot:scaffold23.g4094.t1